MLADTALTLTVAEDAGTPSGAVGSLISAFTGGISDVDSGAVQGIAITATDETHRHLVLHHQRRHDLDGGGRRQSATSSLLLADNASTRLYFAPAANYNGSSTSALTLRGWDQTSGTAGTQGRHLDQWRHHRLLQRHRRDRRDGHCGQRRTGAGRHCDLTHRRLPKTPAGATVRSRSVGSLVSALTGGVADVDTGARHGHRDQRYTVDEANGTWYYTTNGGSTWTALGSVSATSSLLLADEPPRDSTLRAAANYNGTAATALTIRAWDRDRRHHGGRHARPTWCDGGITAFSVPHDLLDVTVKAVNDAPVLADTALTLTVAEDAGAPSGAVGSLVSGFTGGITDVDSGAVKGIAITAQ